MVFRLLSFTIYYTAVLITLSLAVSAQQRDTLRVVDRNARRFVFDIPGVDLYAERFDLSTPAHLHAITVTLTGSSSSGTARLHLYGTEGGAPVPRWGHEIAETRLLAKTHQGAERIRVVFDPPIALSPTQFHIGIGELSPATYLVTDRSLRIASCASPTDTFSYQAARLSNGVWKRLPYGFAVEVEIERVNRPKQFWFADVGTSMQVFDSAMLNRSVSWGDVNHDEYPDLLAGGHLWMNNGGEGFTEVALPRSTTGMPLLNCFVDANLDNAMDILFVAATSEGDTGTYLLLNSGGAFAKATRIPDVFVTNPTSFTLTDLNNDHILDAFIGAGSPKGGCLLMSDGRGSYRNETSSLLGGALSDIETRGCRWLYTPDNELPTLAVLDGRTGRWRTWQISFDAPAVETTPNYAITSSNFGRFYAGDWMDYGTNGIAEVVYGRSITTQAVVSGEPATLMQWGGESDTTRTTSAIALASIRYFTERQAGIATADFNNDGRRDFLLLTSRPCYPIALFVADSMGDYQDCTFEAGLTGLAAGPDALWIDFDNDGRLDLCTVADGHLRLFRNVMEGIDRGTDISQVPSSVATVSGRGQLMQSPLRIRIESGNDHTSLPIESTDSMRLSATPNPFRDRLEILLAAPIGEVVRVVIANANGDHVADIFRGRMTASTKSLEWIPKNSDGRPLPSGTYHVVVEYGHERRTEIVTLVR
jgi:hypothetical protein